VRSERVAENKTTPKNIVMSNKKHLQTTQVLNKILLFYCSIIRNCDDCERCEKREKKIEIFNFFVFKPNHQHWWHEIECYAGNKRVMIRYNDHRKDN
jgi:ABC-type transport system involved in Fe-S cluster assembly fused permease/ATPase subunit